MDLDTHEGKEGFRSGCLHCIWGDGHTHPPPPCSVASPLPPSYADNMLYRQRAAQPLPAAGQTPGIFTFLSHAEEAFGRTLRHKPLLVSISTRPGKLLTS